MSTGESKAVIAIPTKLGEAFSQKEDESLGGRHSASWRNRDGVEDLNCKASY
jgi:hypothetical protein